MIVYEVQVSVAIDSMNTFTQTFLFSDVPAIADIRGEIYFLQRNDGSLLSQFLEYAESGLDMIVEFSGINVVGEFIGDKQQINFMAEGDSGCRNGSITVTKKIVFNNSRKPVFS